MIKNGVRHCDFCYTPHIEWKGKFVELPYENMAWEIEICDSCRLLLRNVIGPVLHRLTHREIVGVIVRLMDEKGISYRDLMKPLLELREREKSQIEWVENDAGQRVTTFELGQGTDQPH